MTAKKPAKTKRAPARAKKDVYGFENAYVLSGLKYVRQVLAGEIPACKWTRLACQRQLDDLERWRNDKAYDFRFDEDLAGRAAEFYEQLPHTQGPLSFQHEDGSWNRLALEPWQCFIVTAVYGWIRKDSPPHRPVRRFTRVYEEVPRGNGKSFKLSGGLLYAFAENEQGVEAYSAAVDREQAAKVYGEAGNMLGKHPELAAALGLEQSSHAIYQRATNSKAICLSREAKKSGDGKNIYFAAVDELHAHPTREVFDVLDTGTGKRGGNALIWVITTAGFNTESVCYEKRGYVQKILQGVVQDETWFGIIYTVDDGEEKEGWTDDACRAACKDHSSPACVWRKANPNWGVSVDPVDFESKMIRAIAVASERNGLLTKHLNIWFNADVEWMDMAAWDRCADPALKEESFRGRPCVIGLDLASKIDIAARVKLFYEDRATGEVDAAGTPKHERHFFAFVRSYLPENRVRASTNSQYDGWARDGWITTTPGDVIDFETVQRDVINAKSEHLVREVAYDPNQATQMSQNLTAEGLTMVEVAQNLKNFSEPMKEWHALVLQGRFHHRGDPAMRWMISNVVCHRDAKDNVYPRKQKPENKIDGPVAALMALNRALLAPPAPPSVYETRGFLTVGSDVARLPRTAGERWEDEL
jgi:phage terminase large subunit-like protein